MASPARTLSKDAPERGIPAIGWINVSILSLLYSCADASTSPFAGAKCAKQNSGACCLALVNHHNGLTPFLVKLESRKQKCERFLTTDGNG